MFVQTEEMIKTEGSYDNETVPVILRYDSNPPQESSMSSATNNEGFFFLKPIEVIKNLSKHKKLLIRYYTYSGNERTVTYNLEGLDKEVPKLMEACHWPEK